MGYLQIVQELSPWRKKEPLLWDFSIKRDIFPRIKKHLDRREATVLIGARQVGKTTLIMSLINELLKKRGVDPLDIYYLNFDYIELRAVANAVDFINNFRIPADKRIYFFLDEIQRLQEPGLFLKQLYDLNRPIKIIATGSSALEIRSKIKETVAGRKNMFEIFPLSFKEFKEFKYPGTKPDRDIFHEYLAFGGYPAVVKEESIEAKQETLRELVNSYYQKDVTDFLKIKHPEKYNDLLKVLASQTGSLINIDELANTLNLDRLTIEKYMEYMRGTYMISYVRPFYRNLRKELTKQKKIYFLDLGVRNYMVNNFSDIHLNMDYGRLVENFVYLKLREENPNEIYFWRTQNKTEIDFVIRSNNKFDLVEVKAKPEGRIKQVRSFESFKKTYPVNSSHVMCFIGKPADRESVKYINIF